MQRDPRAWLWDVREAGTAIQAFVIGLDAAAYDGSSLVHSAVERKFEIIGEALNKLSRYDPALAAKIPNLPQIVAFRNQLIHGYNTINHGLVWHAVQTDLPELLSRVDELLKSTDT